MECVQFAKRLEEFSEGQKKKVLIAASLMTPAHVYIWDEPLNYIDIFSRIQLEQLVADFEGTMLFVEHDNAFCRAVVTDTVNILRRQGKHHLQEVSYDESCLLYTSPSPRD